MLPKVRSLNTVLSLYVSKPLLILATHIFYCLSQTKTTGHFLRKACIKTKILSRILLILYSKELTVKTHQVAKDEFETADNAATKITPIFPHAILVKTEGSGRKLKWLIEWGEIHLCGFSIKSTLHDTNQRACKRDTADQHGLQSALS